MTQCEDKELRDDYYPFKEEQIARNTACESQLIQHEKEIETMKKQIPSLTTTVNKTAGSVAVVGFLFLLLGWSIRTVSTEAREASSKAEKALHAVQLIRNDIKYIQTDVRDMKGINEDIKDINKDTNTAMNKILAHLDL